MVDGGWVMIHWWEVWGSLGGGLGKFGEVWAEAEGITSRHVIWWWFFP